MWESEQEDQIMLEEELKTDQKNHPDQKNDFYEQWRNDLEDHTTISKKRWRGEEDSQQQWIGQYAGEL